MFISVLFHSLQCKYNLHSSAVYKVLLSVTEKCDLSVSSVIPCCEILLSLETDSCLPVVHSNSTQRVLKSPNFFLLSLPRFSLHFSSFSSDSVKLHFVSQKPTLQFVEIHSIMYCYLLLYLALLSRMSVFSISLISVTDDKTHLCTQKPH